MYSTGYDGYDFNYEENGKKWRGLFLNSLKQIQKLVHPSLVSKDDGLLYVESLIFRLLNTIINAPNNAFGSTSTCVTFHHTSDVEDQIKRLFPQPLDKWSIKRAHETMTQLKNNKKSKAVLNFSGVDRAPLKTPVDKFHNLLQKELLHHKTDIMVSQYILSVLEFIATDILQLSGHYVRNMTHTEITPQDIRVAMCADKVLMDLFYGDVDEVALGPPPSAGWVHTQSFRFDADIIDSEYGNIGARNAQSYLDAVKELIREERQFIRDLNLIIKVFRDPLIPVLPPNYLAQIFANIDELLEFSNDFLFSLEDAIELADEEDCPVGACFEDIAEEQAFDVFEKYADDVMSFPVRENLYQLLSKPEIFNPLMSSLGPPMMAALRYVLPQLLLVPVHHCVSYFKAIQNFKELTTSKEDRDSFEQAEALMLPLKTQLEKIQRTNKFGEGYFLRLNGRTNRATALAKMTDIQRAIDGWEGKDIGQSCNEFIMEGPLSKVSGLGIGHRSTRLTERHAFLFDGLIVLCKPNTKRSSMSVTAAVTGRDNSTSSCDWRLKERFLIRNIEITDREDLCDRNSSFYLPGPTPAPLSSGASNFIMGNGEHSPLFSDATSFASISTITNSVGNLSLPNTATTDSTATLLSTNSGSNNSNASNLRYAFEIRPRNQSHIVLVTKTPEEKDRWMSQLILLNTRSMLERTLDSRLQEEAKKHPLQLPHPSSYRFALEDFDTNIIFEENRSSNNSNVPLIKGATLLKLIERLTYHKYGDPMLVRTFLTTYRSFCTPSELLKLLIERFDIPNPDMISCMQAMHFANQELASPTSIHPPPEMLNASGGGDDQNESLPNTGPTSPTSPTQSVMSALDFASNFTFPENEEDKEQQSRDYSEMVKKFRKEYAEPVQFRVMNVLRHWIENHYYDFERDPSLLDTLIDFLDKKKKPPPTPGICLETGAIVQKPEPVPRTMRKLIEHLTKVIDRKKDQSKQENSREIMHNSVAPSIEWWLAKEEDEFDLLTLHPIEIARQLTLLEFDLYRAVKPSELVGTEGQTGVWTKKDKQTTSPNLLKMIRHNSNFTFYLEKCIIEAENFEERTAILMRIIEVMMVLQELNNFNGVIEVMSALNSACVHRLEHTMARIESNSKLKKAFDEAHELSADHFKKYHDKLRSINPPCVPFFGIYLTNILHIEEGNPEYLSPPHHLENMSLHDTSGILSDEAVNCKLINFSKKRKVAEITGEIQQYQNQPYCLKGEPTIRHFLENLAPHGDKTEKEFTDYLYNKSLEIEPRGSKQPIKMPRRWPDRQLKSPGIKTRSQRFAHIPSLVSIDPLISNFANSLSGNHSHSRDNHSATGQHSTPNSASSHIELDNMSLAQQMSPPSTPLTPPQSATHHSHNDTVFANVFIGGQNGPAVSPTTPVHIPSPSNNRFNFPPLPPTSQPPPVPPAGQSPISSSDFLHTPPPLPPRTNRMNSLLQQSPRTRFQPPLPPLSGREEDESSPISNSPPPLPPRSHSVSLGHTGTISRSTSMQSYREPPPPPLPPMPHPASATASSSCHHHSFSSSSHHPPSNLPFIHQRVNSDIILSSSATNGPTVGGPIVRRNSTLEPILPRRYSQGNPPPPLPSVPSSPLHTPLTPPSSSTTTTQPPLPPPLSSPSSTLSPGGPNAAPSPVPELPPKTYRLSNACR